MKPSAELEEAMAEAAASVDRESGEDVTEPDALNVARQDLETALEKTRSEAKELREKWMRSAADLENYRKRAAKEREDAQKYGIEKLLRDFLPVIDDLDRTISVVRDAKLEGSAAQLLSGVELVQKKFLSTLEKHGVASFETLGQSFDPERHEAVQQAPSPDVPSGAVMTELQRGFLIHGRLLRPALVVVSLGAEG